VNSEELMKSLSESQVVMSLTRRSECLRLKLAGGVSLVSWFAVLYFGRMLPFIGTAF
jgi:hypothetical protein